MYPSRVPLCTPYWNSATYRGMLRSVFSGAVIEGPDLTKLRSSVIDELGVKKAILCGSGSLALEIALRACGVEQGDEVVIPTFCCTAVVPPILAAGAAPVPADAGEELNLTAETVEAVLTEKTKAVIVPHLFGNPADIDAIVELARESNIRVVDDAAQALGATIDGRAVGSFGDAGILSFGSEKICFGLGGGVAVSGGKGVLREDAQLDLSPPQLAPALQNLLSMLVWRRWRRWTLPARALLAHASPDTPPLPYRKEKMANLNAAVASTLMETLQENIASRRARARAYRELLGNEKRLELIPHRSGSACLTQVVRVLPESDGADPAAHLIETLGKAGYEVQGSYVPIHLLPPYERFVRTSLPHAERVWSDLIELPCEPEVPLEDVERIATIVKQAVIS